MTQADFMSKAGAEALARKINEHWTQRGVKANAHAERSHGEGEGEIWVVRSDLNYGVPQ
jgi:hypothetical protein